MIEIEFLNFLFRQKYCTFFGYAFLMNQHSSVWRTKRSLWEDVKTKIWNRGARFWSVKHSISVVVWSIISGKGSGHLYFVQGTMKQDQYITLLENRLILQVKEWFPNEDFIFMEDRAPCHTVKRLKEFQVQKNIKLLPWTENSPDLNPIENIWELAKREIARDYNNKKKTNWEAYSSVVS